LKDRIGEVIAVVPFSWRKMDFLDSDWSNFSAFLLVGWSWSQKMAQQQEVGEEQVHDMTTHLCNYI
jgi:hypothetical protein